MPKQETRAPVQICACSAPEDVAGLYVLASDGCIFRLATYKDLRFWDQIEPLPGEEDDSGLLEPLPNDRDPSTRHKALCAALQQLALGADLSELTTREIVEACRAVVADADSDEILAALRSVQS